MYVCKYIPNVLKQLENQCSIVSMQEFVQNLDINSDALQTAAKATAGTATATVSTDNMVI